MALQSSGVISLANINTELGYSSTSVITMNDSSVRTLAGKASGAIALTDFYGKSAAATYTCTFTSDNQGWSSDQPGGRTREPGGTWSSTGGHNDAGCVLMNSYGTIDGKENPIAGWTNFYRYYPYYTALSTGQTIIFWVKIQVVSGAFGSYYFDLYDGAYHRYYSSGLTFDTITANNTWQQCTLTMTNDNTEPTSIVPGLLRFNFLTAAGAGNEVNVWVDDVITPDSWHL